MNKKDNSLAGSEFLELTDADLEVVSGGHRCYGDYPYDDTNSYFFSSSETDNTQSNNGFLNIPIASDNNSYTSNRGILNGIDLL